MTPNDDITYDLHLDRTLEAPRALVWEAWTDPAQLAGWWGPEQFTIPRCEADVRPGGQLRIDMQGPDGTVYPMNGTFAEVVEPERLVLLTAALDDEDYLHWYVGEVLASRPLFETALQGLKVPYWPSQANFVLVGIGPKHREFVTAMRTRSVLVRDRSNDPGCDGCVRITLGTREQTRQGIAALEESLTEIGWSR